MRTIDIPGAKEIFAKQDELMVTFWMNKGFTKALTAIHEAVRDDYVFNKMQNMRMKNNARIMREKFKDVDPYETAAAAFYKQYGTSGEF